MRLVVELRQDTIIRGVLDYADEEMNLVRNVFDPQMAVLLVLLSSSFCKFLRRNSAPKYMVPSVLERGTWADRDSLIGDVLSKCMGNWGGGISMVIKIAPIICAFAEMRLGRRWKLLSSPV